MSTMESRMLRLMKAGFVGIGAACAVVASYPGGFWVVAGFFAGAGFECVRGFQARSKNR